jgi:hypothetical protein
MKTAVLFVLIFCGGIGLGSPQALAVTLEFEPAFSGVAVGQQAIVDVVISGLAQPPSVGTFDLDVGFDPMVLSPVAVDFGVFLGDPGLGDALTSVALLPAVIDFAEVSLLSPALLDQLQPARFPLATISFNVLTAGTSPLFFSQTIVDDAFGEKLDVEARGGSITSVPEPGTLLLVAAGAALGASSRGLRRAAATSWRPGRHVNERSDRSR